MIEIVPSFVTFLGISITNPSTGLTKVAQFHSPWLSFGATHVYFPPDSSHCIHELTVKPVSVKRRAQTFVKDSVLHIWAPASGASVSRDNAGSGKLSLFKAVASKQIESARYESVSGKFELGGLLVLEEREVDALVAVLTVVDVLGQNDAFYAPGLDLVGR